MKLPLRSIALALGLSLSLCASDAAAQAQQIRLRDDKGQPVRNAEVSVDCNGKRSVGNSDGNGVFSWGAMPPSTRCVVAITHPKMEVFNAELSISAYGLVFAEYVLTRKPVWIIQVTVIDEEKKSPVEGAGVRFECGDYSVWRTTNAGGVTELDRLLAATHCSLTIEHVAYESRIATIPVLKGMTEAVPYQFAIKRKANVKIVRVTVLDDATGLGLEDASVALIGWAIASIERGTTGSTGEASIMVPKSGRFGVEVSRSYYRAGKGEVLVDTDPGTSEYKTTVRLSRVDQPAGFPIDVVVSGKALDGKTYLLQGASVSGEGGSPGLTGPNGVARLHLHSDIGDEVVLTAFFEGYETAEKRFLIQRISGTVYVPEVPITLNERKPEFSGVSLVIEVTNQADGKTISGASVSIADHGTTVTDSRGQARFAISGESMKNRLYLRAIAKKDGYVDKWSDIYAELLKPGADDRLYSMQMAVNSAPGLVGSYTAPGAIWHLKDGYPKPNKGFQDISQMNPVNKVWRGGMTYQHQAGVTSTFSFRPPPDEMEVGKSYEASLTGVSVSAADQAACGAIAMIWVDAPTKSIHDGRLIGSKRSNSSYYVTPLCKNMSGPPNYTNADRVSFEFRPTNPETFTVTFAPLGPAGYLYVYEPFRPAPR